MSWHQFMLVKFIINSLRICQFKLLFFIQLLRQVLTGSHRQAADCCAQRDTETIWVLDKNINQAARQPLYSLLPWPLNFKFLFVCVWPPGNYVCQSNETQCLSLFGEQSALIGLITILISLHCKVNFKVCIHILVCFSMPVPTAACHSCKPPPPSSLWLP